MYLLLATESKIPQVVKAENVGYGFLFGMEFADLPSLNSNRRNIVTQIYIYCYFFC